MTARTIAQQKHERFFAAVLELDLNICQNTYGAGRCTAGRVDSGIVHGGAATSITLAATTSSANGAYKDMVARKFDSQDVAEERKITAYDGATKVATVTPAWTVAPLVGDRYDVIDRPNACYNSFATCQDKPNYERNQAFDQGTYFAEDYAREHYNTSDGSYFAEDYAAADYNTDNLPKTYRFCSRGVQAPTGELVRPYIARSTFVPTQIPERGLAMRSNTQIIMEDEPDNDAEQDPYLATRTDAAGGTFWPRLIARNPNYIGRFARVRKGYVVTPWDWSTFIDELYVIESIKGPNRSGSVTVVLSDPVKLADRTKIPTPTDGKLTAELKAVENTGTAQAGTANTIKLANSASAVDGFYVDFEAFIRENTGSGQRKKIISYVGATRLATVDSNWSVNPDATSVYDVGVLKFTLSAGKGAQYTDPATSGKNEYVRIEKEVVRYTFKVGDTLSWPDTTHRAQFGTARADHKVKDGVQLCRAFENALFKDVVKALLNESGLADQHIDLAQLAAEDTTWLSEKYRITVCLTEPAQVSNLLSDLSIDAQGMAWWHPTEQKFKFKVNMPEITTGIPLLTDEAQFIKGSVQVERKDTDTLTRAIVRYNPVSATANLREEQSFLSGERFIDADAEHPNELGAQRDDIRYSRWLGPANDLAATALAARRVIRLRNAPSRIKFKLDPKDYTLSVGQLVDLDTRRIVDESGTRKPTRVRIVKLEDEGARIDCEAVTTTFGKRYWFIGPPGLPDYASATEAQRDHAFIAGANGKMSDQSGAYLII